MITPARLDEIITKDEDSIGVGSKGPVVKMIQQVLVANGAVLRIDSDYGPVTEAAVRRFQAEHEIGVDGWVGPVTAGKMTVVQDDPPTEGEPESVPSIMKAAPWLAEMRAITGVREVPGGRNSPIIMSWRGEIGRAFPKLAPYAATYTGDAIPWCGFGLARCMAVRGVEPPKSFMWALSWSQWGRRLRTPIVGCVMTFKRSGGGHVALLEKISGDTCWIRGCNQSDMVNVTRRSMSGFQAATWPKEWPLPKTRIAGDISNSTTGGSMA